MGDPGRALRHCCLPKVYPKSPANVPLSDTSGHSVLPGMMWDPGSCLQTSVLEATFSRAQGGGSVGNACGSRLLLRLGQARWWLAASRGHSLSGVRLQLAATGLRPGLSCGSVDSTHHLTLPCRARWVRGAGEAGRGVHGARALAGKASRPCFCHHTGFHGAALSPGSPVTF